MAKNVCAAERELCEGWVGGGGGRLMKDSPKLHSGKFAGGSRLFNHWLMPGIKSQGICASACLKFTFISQELYYFMKAFAIQLEKDS